MAYSTAGTVNVTIQRYPCISEQIIASLKVVTGLYSRGYSQHHRSRRRQAPVWHGNYAEGHADPRPASVQGFDEPGTIFAVSQLVYVMPVADPLTERYSGKPLVPFYPLRGHFEWSSWFQTELVGSKETLTFWKKSLKWIALNWKLAWVYWQGLSKRKLI